MEELFSYIKKFGLLNESDQLLIAAGIQEIKIRKGETFVEAGKPSQRIAFVKDGVFRSLYYNKQGDDFTRYFIYEGRFIGDFQGFTDQLPAHEDIEAITDAVLLVIDLKHFKVLEEKISVWP
ncbi:MAG TPA: Crp/Fnr family transcriptional regulator, partial [Chryseobacterium indologenes]|nr:Crp/Fnr family transcriptional regulator [Chryseobacterium indologenes]